VILAYALREVVEAMNLSVPNGDYGFAPECHKPVKPFKSGSTVGGAHFEHLTGIRSAGSVISRDKRVKGALRLSYTPRSQ
jgi:hypothetical protein